MAYTVLARKYRSTGFDDVVGQGPIAATLANAIKTGRIHHGYLFTGTRGVGKTSMARILAKALNCLASDGPTVTPCNTCDVCRAVAEGQDVDVIEIDAASNTGVDNIRDLRSNTAYRPARTRFKVYIIDEVHMLSTGAFNALLKTLEEPPAHVKFILATTEVQKVPATIQSRCQRFNFRHIGPDDIADRLRFIVAAEGAAADDAVIRRVARLANGSMRDALSILDQLMSVSPTQLSADALDELLPPAANERIIALLQHAAAGDAAAALRALDAVVAEGRGLEQFASEALEVVRALMLIRTCGVDAGLVDVPAGQDEAYATLAAQFELSHYVQVLPMLDELRRHVRVSGAGRALAEAVVLRIAKLREWTPIEQLVRRLSGGDAEAPAQKKTLVAEASAPPGAAATPAPQPVVRREAPALPAPPPGDRREPPPPPPARGADASARPSTAPICRPPPSAPYDDPAALELPIELDATPPAFEAVSMDADEIPTATRSVDPQWVAGSANDYKTVRANLVVRDLVRLFDAEIVQVSTAVRAAAVKEDE